MGLGCLCGDGDLERGAGDGDYADVVFLAEGLRGAGYFGRGFGGAQKLANAIEAEEVAMGIGGLDNSIGHQ